MSDASVAARKLGFLSFRGPNGIRAGWSILIFLLIWAAVLFLLYTGIFYVFHVKDVPKDEIPLPLGLASQFAQTIPVLVAMYVVARIERRPFSQYGLSSASALKLWIVGVVGGLASLSLVIATLAATSHVSFDGIALHGLPAIGFGLAWGVAFGLTGVGEELLWRGFLLSTLARPMGFWPAALVSSVVFSLMHMHNPGENLTGIVQVFVAGMLLCALVRASGSLWLGIGFHSAWDWAQSYLYGTADSGLLVQGHLLITHPLGDKLLSGGDGGPEASLFCPPIMILGVVLVTASLRFIRHPVARTSESNR